MATRSSGRLACLDGLRGFAAIHIVLCHLDISLGENVHPLINLALAPFRHGLKCVPLMLVLSGFVLTHARIRKGPSPSFGSYLAGRWRRIGLPYYAAALLYLALTVCVATAGGSTSPIGWLDLRQVVTHFLFVHGFWADTFAGINFPFWTLSIIFQFYLAFPLLFGLWNRWDRRLVLAAMVAISVAWRALIVTCYGWENFHLVDGVLWGRWSEFALGMALAFWHNGPDPVHANRRLGAGLGAGTLILLGIALGLRARGQGYMMDFFFAAGYACLVGAALHSATRGGRLSRLLGHRYAGSLGTISYSLYLTHNLVLGHGLAMIRRVLMDPGLPTDTLLVVVSLTACLGVAWIFHRLVETRCGSTTARGSAPCPVVAARPAPVSPVSWPVATVS